MDSLFDNEPVSSAHPAFRGAAESALSKDEPLVLLLRHANRAGAKSYFVARTIREFDDVMAGAASKTSISVFFRSNFAFHGIVDGRTAGRLAEVLASLEDENEGVDLVCVDSKDVELDRDHYAYLRSNDAIQRWVAHKQGRPILAGMLPFWVHNCDDVLTAYVPDSDGVVRPGAY